MAVAAKEIGHEVADASKQGAEKVAAAAKRGAAKTKEAVKGEKKPATNPGDKPAQ